MTTISLPDDVLGTLGEGRQAYIAAPSAHGPHVTPELYAWSGGRLWFAAASTTLKAKVLDRERRGGALVATPGRSVLLHGDVEVHDPRDAKAVLATLRNLPDVTRASASFVTRNAPDLLAFLGDTARGRLGRRLPPVRVLFALSPTHAARVENDVLTGCWGGWELPAAAEEPDVPAGGVAAVAALPGPVAVPARWFEQGSELRVPAGLLDLLALEDAFPMSLVTDEYVAPGPAAKQGTLLRGEGARTDEPGLVRLDPERIVEWDGVDTSSSPAT